MVRIRGRWLAQHRIDEARAVPRERGRQQALEILHRRRARRRGYAQALAEGDPVDGGLIQLGHGLRRLTRRAQTGVRELQCDGGGVASRRIRQGACVRSSSGRPAVSLITPQVVIHGFRPTDSIWLISFHIYICRLFVGIPRLAGSRTTRCCR